jgi:CubicO group peptidase (beta-lactamase class C family)
MNKYWIKNKFGISILRMFFISTVFFQASCGPSATPPVVLIPSPPAGADDLNLFLEEVRSRYNLPGIAAAVFNSDNMIAIGAAGTRKVNSAVPLIYTDKIQIASISKTMTATITARLIEDSLLSWNTTLAELYPELAASMKPAYRTVTIEMLLRHTGGLPQWMRNDDIVKSWTKKHRQLSLTEQRYEAVKYMLSISPEYVPGSRNYYTNDSYLILGNICERVAKKTCEDLFREYIFAPLQMHSSGFGQPWADRSLNNPWGHVMDGDKYRPYTPVPRTYGDISFGTPYGSIVHGSVVDLAKYGIWHLRGDLGLDSTLSSSTFRKLHHATSVQVAPATQVFAAGFFNEGRTDSASRWTNVQHWGYYARGRTLFWFSPQANVGAVILTNGTDEDEVKGMQPLSEVVIELFKRYRANAVGQ